MKSTLQKIISAMLVFAVILTSLSFALGEATVYLLGTGKNSAAYQLFIQAHPELTVEIESNIFLSTNEMISAMLTGEFPYDTFVMTSSSFDVRQMFKIGYCADVSESSVLTTELGKMYKPIEQFLMHDGSIHGMPFSFYMGYYTYDPEAWAAAGLSEEYVPTSFEEYLEFLEAWIERIKDDPQDAISVCNTFDSEQYGEHSYINYLVDQLVTNYIMQCNYAGESLRFDTTLFRDTLARCQRIGMDLYANESEQKGDLGLFYDLHGMRNLTYLVPLRMTANQPILIKATLYMVFVNQRSKQQALAREYIENCVACIEPEIGAYLYRDAEPIEQEGYARSMDALEQRLADSGTTIEPMERNTMEDKLQKRNSNGRKWLPLNSDISYHQPIWSFIAILAIVSIFFGGNNRHIPIFLVSDQLVGRTSKTNAIWEPLCCINFFKRTGRFV